MSMDDTRLSHMTKGRFKRLKAYGAIGGLGNLVALAGAQSAVEFPDTSRSSGQALKGDWVVLGKDMRRASNKVMAGGKR